MRQNEIRHLRAGPEPNEKPEGLGIVRFVARCPGNSETVLNRCKEVLFVVLQQDADHWPSDGRWRALLPEWFVAQCSKELTKEEADRWLKAWHQLPPEEQSRAVGEIKWSVANWVYWFQPDERQWFWWDAMIKDPNTIQIAVEVLGWPFPWGELDWLLRASGATSVDPEE